MISSPSVSGRKRMMKLGHGINPKERMKDYTDKHTYTKESFSIAFGFSKDKKETKPIKSSLRCWPLNVGPEKAKEIERMLAWFLHNEMGFENHYLYVLRKQVDGNLPDIYRTTKDGNLIWSGAKELHYLGAVTIDKLLPEKGPTARYKIAVKEIERILRENKWLSV